MAKSPRTPQTPQQATKPQPAALSQAASKPPPGMKLLTTTQSFVAYIDEMTKRGESTEAILALYRRWLANPPDAQSFLVWYNYGALLQLTGRLDDAIAAYKASLTIAPNFPPPVINWGLCEELKGNVAGAIDLWRENLPHIPDHPPELASLKVTALNHLARASEDLKRYEDSGRYLLQTLQIDPKQPDAIHHWVHLQQLTCHWPIIKPVAGINASQQLLSTSPFAMLALSDEPAQQLLCAREYVHRKFGMKEGQLHRGGSALRTGKGRLRLGYVSGDLCTHAVGLLLPSVLESHDRERVELFAYDYSPEDGTSHRQRLLRAFDHLRSIKGLGDTEAAQLIAHDEIDVLIDLHGLSQGARPGIYAQRPAPKQGHYLGFIGSTGMPWMDFVVVDRYVFPKALESFFPETPLFVDGCFLPLAPADIKPRSFGREDCGLPEDRVVLAAFGNVYKITQATFELWLSILKQAPQTVLWILNDNPVATEHLQHAARQAGVLPDRLIFAGRVPYGEFSARLSNADVFLDAYPYNCGSTARDVIHADLPMVTLSGRTMVSRMGGSVLTAIGATDGIATTPAAYVSKVLERVAAADGLRLKRQALAAARDEAPRLNPHGIALAQSGRGISRAIEGFF